MHLPHQAVLGACEELAGKLNINPEELQDALYFLHHHMGMLLYYPEIEALKDTVICDQQVVYDSTSNLIRNTFTFEKVGEKLSKQFKEKAQFSLKDVKKATSEHTDNLIPLGKLVKLLESRNVLTVIPPTSSSAAETRQEPVYFMPCVLRNAKPGELSIRASSSDSDPAPLMLRYNCGYVPVGVFPVMIASSLSKLRVGS